jgi:integrase
MSEWVKLRDLPEFLELPEAKKPPFWLEARRAVRGAFFRVRYRRDGINVERNIGSSFENWKEAAKKGDLLIAQTKAGVLKVHKDLTRCEDLCRQIVRLKEAKASGTYDQAETMFRLHLIPYLNQHCPYATSLTHVTWLEYKTYKRIENPRVALFNHWKFFTMLCRFAWQKGILPLPMRLDFDEETEDFREEGLIIPDEDFVAMINAAGKTLRDRLIVQRKTGTRPSETRCLQKTRCSFVPDCRINLRREDTKTRKARSFVVEDLEVIEILNRRWRATENDFLFPSATGDNKPLSPNFRDWSRMIERAKVNPDYTPHDLRHTYLTEMFKTSAPPALICYQAGLSMEEAQKTYLHFKAEDTRAIANIVAQKSRPVGQAGPTG